MIHTSCALCAPCSHTTGVFQFFLNKSQTRKKTDIPPLYASGVAANNAFERDFERNRAGKQEVCVMWCSPTLMRALFHPPRKLWPSSFSRSFQGEVRGLGLSYKPFSPSGILQLFVQPLFKKAVTGFVSITQTTKKIVEHTLGWLH